MIIEEKERGSRCDGEFSKYRHGSWTSWTCAVEEACVGGRDALARFVCVLIAIPKRKKCMSVYTRCCCILPCDARRFRDANSGCGWRCSYYSSGFISLLRDQCAKDISPAFGDWRLLNTRKEDRNWAILFPLGTINSVWGAIRRAETVSDLANKINYIIYCSTSDVTTGDHDHNHRHCFLHILLVL